MKINKQTQTTLEKRERGMRVGERENKEGERDRRAVSVDKWWRVFSCECDHLFNIACFSHSFPNCCCLHFLPVPDCDERSS